MYQVEMVVPSSCRSGDYESPRALEIIHFHRMDPTLCVSVIEPEAGIDVCTWLDLAGAEKLATALIQFIRNHPDVAPSLSSEAVTR